MLIIISILFLGTPVSKSIGRLFSITIILSLIFFLTNNILTFYITYEFTILPVGLIVLLWGTQPERIRSLFYLSIYRVIRAFPLIFLLFSYPTYLIEVKFFSNFLLSLGIRFTFLVKIPLFGLHLWLPKAHVEAPSLGRIILAGLLLKLGSWGLIILSEFIFLLGKPIFVLSILGITIGSLIAITQSDSKSLVAYSSVCHMNFIIAVFVYMPSLIKRFRVIIMFAHGVTSSYIFWITGVIFYKKYTRQIIYLGGLTMMSSSMIIITTILFFTNFGVPPSLTFLQEISYVIYIVRLSYFISLIVGIYLIIVCYYSLYYLNLFNMPANFEGTDRVSDNYTPLLGVFLSFNWLILSCII